jgi:carbamoyl-phosphate synthase large subunit
VRPVFKRIDTCAAEFASPTAYMYSTYEAPFAGAAANEAQPSDKKKVIILGGGPNRIGPGHRVRLLLCHACFALHEAGYESIMVNCNPETVSTDYDTSDRLYFEPLTPEDVLEIIDTERSNGTLHGVIVQFGGQTPLKLAEALEKGRCSDPRHIARRDRPRRRPQPLQAATRPAEAPPARERQSPTRWSRRG